MIKDCPECGKDMYLEDIEEDNLHGVKKTISIWVCDDCDESIEAEDEPENPDQETDLFI